MAKVVTGYNNFARAKVDHDMMARYDLPVYNTGSDLFRNFISNFKGNAIFRAGFESLIQFQDCALTEFKFSATQSYILVMFNLKMRFLAFDSNNNFGWVLDGASNILEITTPYTLAEAKVICKGKPAQNADVMVITHNAHPPMRLKRDNANSFTLYYDAIKFSPFIDTLAAPVALTNITQANPGVVTQAAHGRSTGDIVRILSVVGMTEINNFSVMITVIDPNTYSIGIDTTKFTAYSSGGTTEKYLTFDWPALSLFYKSRLYYGATPKKGTTAFASEQAHYENFELPTVVTDTSALQFTIAEISQKIEWMFGGDNSLILGSADGIVAVNGGGVNVAIKADTVEASLTSADGSNDTYPLRKDGFIFYVGRNARNVYYFSYDLLTEQFVAQDANFISYDITLGGFNKIRYKKDRNDLIFGSRGDGDLCTINFNNQEKIIGWHEHESLGTFQDIASISDHFGNPQFFSLVIHNGTYFIEQQSEYVQFGRRVNFFTGTDQEVEDNRAYYRYIAEQLKECNFLDNSLEYSDLRTATITYDSGTGRITAGGASFTNLDVGKHIVYKTVTGYEHGRFEITNYISNVIVEVAVLQEPSSNSYSSWYKTFSTLSGLAQYNGTTVGVVVDGGYKADYLISGGAQDLDQQCCHVRIGYRYKGVIKSFCLGFVVQGANTQTTYKNICRIGARMVNSLGGQVGSSLYKMEPIQERTQNDLNYLPPLPIDGTKYIGYVDDSEIEKYFYIVQDEPSPLVCAGVMLEAEYAISS